MVGSGLAITPIADIYEYDAASDAWSADKVGELDFANWGMRIMVDEHARLMLMGGYAFSASSLVSATDSTFHGLVGLDEAFADVTIDTSLAVNKSLVQSFDFATKAVAEERSFFFGEIQRELTESLFWSYTWGFWEVYRFKMVRMVTTWLRQRKVVWSMNITFVENGTEWDCDTPAPSVEPTTTTTTPSTTTTLTPTTTTTTTWGMPTTTSYVWGKSKAEQAGGRVVDEGGEAGSVRGIHRGFNSAIFIQRFSSP